MPAPYRFAIIGASAGIFATHVRALSQTAGRLVAIAGRTETLGRERAAACRCAYYPDYRPMLADLRPDVAVILTPHPTHAAIGIDCLESGCHVLVEKPVAIEMAEADALFAAADRAGRLAAVCFQQRARPEVRVARALLQSGALGRLQRVELVAPWTRTRAYYRSASWRGRWHEEGGGVLLNQASHDLDLLCFLLGLPRRVQAWTRTAWHAIQVEDTAHGLFEWEDGLLGYFQASTAEGWPALRRFDIVGTRGYLQIRGDHLVFEQSATDLHDTLAVSPQISTTPATQPQAVTLEAGRRGDHLAVYTNLIAALDGTEPLLAEARSAAQSLELANAMTLSSHRNRPVDLPLDREQYRQLLIQLQAD